MQFIIGLQASGAPTRENHPGEINRVTGYKSADRRGRHRRAVDPKCALAILTEFYGPVRRGSRWDFQLSSIDSPEPAIGKIAQKGTAAAQNDECAAALYRRSADDASRFDKQCATFIYRGA